MNIKNNRKRVSLMMVMVIMMLLVIGIISTVMTMVTMTNTPPAVSSNGMAGGINNNERAMTDKEVDRTSRTRRRRSMGSRMEAIYHSTMATDPNMSMMSHVYRGMVMLPLTMLMFIVGMMTMQWIRKPK